jgi:predicted alpha-1,6-mannanase (GH76 family)
MFPFWSRATINRVINSLENRGLINVGNFNRKKYDKTRWFAINIGEATKLKSIKVVKREQCAFQNELGLVQIETDSDLNETTIPNMTTDITPEKELICR